MKFSKPGDLLQASRNPKMKRSVMKAIGMPMKKKRKASPVKMPTKRKSARKGSESLVKAPMDRFVRKGSMGMVKSPKANMRLRTKKKVAKKGTSGTSFGDESIQGSKMERQSEGAKHFKRSKKG